MHQCLNSQTKTVWKTLGSAWTTPEPDWTDYVPPFEPHFRDLPQECEILWAHNTNGQQGVAKKTILQDISVNHNFEGNEESVGGKNQQPSTSQNVEATSTFLSSPATDTPFRLGRESTRLQLDGSDWKNRQTRFICEVNNRNGRLFLCTQDKVARTPYELTIEKNELAEVSCKQITYLHTVGSCS